VGGGQSRVFDAKKYSVVNVRAALTATNTERSGKHNRT
jgi:hypothetical protein